MMRVLLSVLAVLLTIAPALADVAPFTTPSGNIQCSAGIDRGTPSDVYCTIFDRAGPPPAPGLANCNDAFGYEFSMGERGAVTVKCGRFPRDLASAGDNPVSYGSTVKYGGIVCRSSTSGLGCRNADRHGFFLSRRRQSVF
jgi:hypothetical protein